MDFLLVGNWKLQLSVGWSSIVMGRYPYNPLINGRKYMGFPGQKKVGSGAPMIAVGMGVSLLTAYASILFTHMNGINLW